MAVAAQQDAAADAAHEDAQDSAAEEVAGAEEDAAAEAADEGGGEAEAEPVELAHFRRHAMRSRSLLRQHVEPPPTRRRSLLRHADPPPTLERYTQTKTGGRGCGGRRVQDVENENYGRDPHVTPAPRPDEKALVVGILTAMSFNAIGTKGQGEGLVPHHSQEAFDTRNALVSLIS